MTSYSFAQGKTVRRNNSFHILVLEVALGCDFIAVPESQSEGIWEQVHIAGGLKLAHLERYKAACIWQSQVGK